MKAEGSFEVEMKPVSTSEGTDGVMLGRWSLDKQFLGDLQASGVGEVLTAGTKNPGSAAYVAIEEIKGSLHGRSGSFVFQHTATMNRGFQSLTITVVPDSGSGELAGISGSFLISIIDGKHFYEFNYELAQTEQNLVADVSVEIAVDTAAVWNALTNPAMVKQYMFGTEVISDWKEGSPIVWRGIWEGKPYADKGVIIQSNPNKVLALTHYSPLTGAPDVPENYHTLKYELQDLGGRTTVRLTQDNNATKDEQEHSEKMWSGMLERLKELLEK